MQGGEKGGDRVVYPNTSELTFFDLELIFGNFPTLENFSRGVNCFFVLIKAYSILNIRRCIKVYILKGREMQETINNEYIVFIHLKEMQLLHI